MSSTELATYTSAAVLVSVRETKGKAAAGRGGLRLRRRNSLVKEFKWNDEKKLEGRTG